LKPEPAALGATPWPLIIAWFAAGEPPPPPLYLLENIFDFRAFPLFLQVGGWIGGAEQQKKNIFFGSLSILGY
jgi:hypothetical protein